MPFHPLIASQRYGLHAMGSPASMPSNITIFLGNISFLLDSLGKETPEALQEYDGILFPTYKKNTVFSEGCNFPDVKPPSQAEFEAVPAMDSTRHKCKIVPSDDESSDDNSIPDLSKPPLKKKTKADVIKNPPKEPLTISDDEIQSAGTKYPQESDEKDDGKPKRSAKNKSAQSIRTRITALMPDIEAALIELTTSKGSFMSVHGFGKSNLIISLMFKQGNKNYIPHSSLGPASTTDAPLISHLDFTNHVSLPVDKALAATWTCALCCVFKADCVPNSLGIKCVHYSIKKVGHHNNNKLPATKDTDD
ncbi:hypothetical protein B0H13DRAFT_2378301 [Mycena leptocephala]|nr:hypothetical protein B0H13DRAFT_2378301 [Mycena leptocephala]